MNPERVRVYPEKKSKPRKGLKDKKGDSINLKNRESLKTKKNDE